MINKQLKVAYYNCYKFLSLQKNPFATLDLLKKNEKKILAKLLVSISRLSLKRGFSGCGHGFGGRDGFDRLGGFNGLGGFGGFNGLSGFGGFSVLGRFSGFVF